MFRTDMGRARHVASLALAMLLVGAPTAASAAEDEEGFGGDLFSGITLSDDESDSSDDDAMTSEQLAALGIIDMQASFGRQLRTVGIDMLGTAAIGGIVLHQLTGSRQVASPVMRSLPTGGQLDVTGGGSAPPSDATIVTPEPGTVVLMGSGLALLAFISYRRSRRVPQRLPHRSTHRPQA